MMRDESKRGLVPVYDAGGGVEWKPAPVITKRTVEAACREVAAEMGFELKVVPEFGIEAWAKGERQGHCMTWAMLYNWLRSPKAKKRA